MKPSVARLIARWWVLAGILYAIITVVAAARWVLRTTPITIVQAPKRADLLSGATIRVSSWDGFHEHHPLFAVDGEERPTTIEKWASAPGDRRPWISADFGRSVNVESIVLHLAIGPDEPVSSRYVLRCLGTQKSWEITSPTREPHPRHQVACDGASGVRVEFLGAPPARLYELEVIGKP